MTKVASIVDIVGQLGNLIYILKLEAQPTKFFKQKIALKKVIKEPIEEI